MRVLNETGRGILVAAVLALAAVTGTGCAVIAVGAVVGGFAYAEGELTGQLNSDIYRAVDATKRAASRLQLTPTMQKGDETMARMTAEDRYGNKVNIRLTPAGPRQTEVAIRVNAFGDEAYSRRVLAEIQRNL